MATLSKDGTKSWQAHGVVRRDAKHMHAGPETSGKGVSKDKKRYCRGKVGREHFPLVMISIKYVPTIVKYCVKCSKEFDRYLGHGPVPDWVPVELLKNLRQAEALWRTGFAKRTHE
jgi:hypothetical protein